MKAAARQLTAFNGLVYPCAFAPRVGENLLSLAHQCWILGRTDITRVLRVDTDYAPFRAATASLMNALDGLADKFARSETANRAAQSPA